MRLVWAVLLLPVLMAQAAPRNAEPGVRYVGSKICAGCSLSHTSDVLETG